MKARQPYMLAVLLLIAAAILLRTSIKQAHETSSPPPIQEVRPTARTSELTRGNAAGVLRARPGTTDRHTVTTNRPETMTVAPPAPPTPTAAGADVIPGEWLLSFYNARDQERFLAAARQHGVRVLDRMDLGHSVRIRSTDPQQLAALLAAAPVPVSRGRNHYVRIPENETPASPRSAIVPTGYASFGPAAAAWLGVPAEREDWGRGVTVAILDTGVLDHSALNAERIKHISLVESGGENEESSGHGTAVASLIAGSSDAVKGIAPASDILDIQVLGADGTGDSFTLARGIMAAVEAGAQIINICIGTDADNPILRQAVDAAAAAGAIIVAAPGNSGKDGVAYPARYESVLAIPAVDANGQHADFSSTGPAVDLAAPGVGIYAAWSNNTFVGFSGTSASVPIVSAAIAGLMSLDPGLSPTEAAKKLVTYADDTGTAGADPFTGHGILNMARVLSSNTPDIHDIAVGTPFVEFDEVGNLAINIAVQNRGTEPANVTKLTAKIGGTMQEISLYDLAPTESAGKRFLVNPDWVSDQGEIEVNFGVTTPGDTNDRNDHYLSKLTVKKPEPATTP